MKRYHRDIYMSKAPMTSAGCFGALAVILLAADLNAAARVLIVMGLFAFGIGFGLSLSDNDAKVEGDEQDHR